MRKIVKESVDMFMGNIPGARFTLGWRWSKSNTVVKCIFGYTYNTIFMELHGNCIAIRKVYRDNINKDEIIISLSGWATPTTISRLNGICGANRLRRRGGEVYYNGVKIDAYDWININKKLLKPMFHEYENN